MRSLKQLIARLAPSFVLSLYHVLLAFLGALLYGFPSEKLTVIAVTGTKGKSSTIEFLNAILEEAGYKTALVSSIRIKLGDTSEPNTLGRSMPGRFFLQRFLSRALRADCSVAILEMTSEGARQHRHRCIELDALIFTNLAPEHIESHGSYENYANAKFEIARQLVRSNKRSRILVANGEDPAGLRYLALPVERALPFSLSLVAPFHADEKGGSFTLEGLGMHIALPGEFSLKNALAAAVLARTIGVSPGTIQSGLQKVEVIPGRVEEIRAGQDFLVVVDYAHTPDSLQALLTSYGARRKICVFGSAGGGRDSWKRPVMGKIAEKYCARIILTTDDPYDENPGKIITEIASGMKNKPEMIEDRRLAIREALLGARVQDAVLIVGKGIDPIHGPRGATLPWNDVEVAREELTALLKRRSAPGL
ncbi:MAG: UDP-N-acetylmuramoyl-L-alanyl-D-glutamate-2,6-diaminopimelate ligase [Parcubacteria group bacterium GW2011_GWA2_51_10]|nr:MAG: UDP-N-acetylmuramoyl-L-alanyl-D-glutamate-2,6-diaminopimelate ligase [Parcubacteria group bacterium GW2011_GWA2_51_10]